MESSSKFSDLNKANLIEIEEDQKTSIEKKLKSFDRFEKLVHEISFDEQSEPLPESDVFQEKQKAVEHKLFELKQLFSDGLKTELELRRFRSVEIALSGEVSQLKTKLNAAQEELRLAKNEYIKFKAVSDEKIEKIDTLRREQFIHFAKLNSEKSEKIKSLNEDNLRLNDQVTRLTETIYKLNSDNEKTVNQVNEYFKLELEKLNRVLSSKQSTIDTMLIEKTNYQSELQEFERELLGEIDKKNQVTQRFLSESELKKQYEQKLLAALSSLTSETQANSELRSRLNEMQTQNARLLKQHQEELCFKNELKNFFVTEKNILDFHLQSEMYFFNSFIEKVSIESNNSKENKNSFRSASPVPLYYENPSEDLHNKIFLTHLKLVFDKFTQLAQENKVLINCLKIQNRQHSLNTEVLENKLEELETDKDLLKEQNLQLEAKAVELGNQFDAHSVELNNLFEARAVKQSTQFEQKIAGIKSQFELEIADLSTQLKNEQRKAGEPKINAVETLNDYLEFTEIQIKELETEMKNASRFTQTSIKSQMDQLINQKTLLSNILAAKQAARKK